jgi:hypothetical protein
LTLPTSAGTNGYGLVTDGSGNTSWSAIPSGTINTATIGQITYYSGTNALSGTTTGTGVLTALGNNTNSAGGLPVLDGSGYVAVAQGGTGLGSGTSGGVLYYSATGTLASSAALASNAIIVGGGAGVAPSTVTTGTGVLTALGVNTGSAGAFVVNGGALGTPLFGDLSNCTGLPISTGVSGLGSNVGTFLATPSSANLAAAVTDETGSGPLVFATTPTFTSSITLGTQQTTRGSIVLANTAAAAYSTTVQSSNSATAAWTLTLPTTAGTSSQVLTTDGTGVTSWATASGGGATGGGTDKIFWNNEQTVNTSYSIPASTNAGSFGPITVASGATVTVPSGSNWVVV